MDIRIRRASVADVHALGELIYIAAKGGYATSGYDFSVGGTREYQISKLTSLAAAAAPSWFHYAHFSVAEHEGRVVAAVAGFDRGETNEHMGSALREIGWSDLEIELLNARLDPIYECFPGDPPDAWTIEHVAAVPEFRRRGLVRQLLAAEIERGRQAGYRIAQLEVFSTNRPAIALYESAGFQRTAEFGDETFQRLLRRDEMWRMTRGLQ